MERTLIRYNPWWEKNFDFSSIDLIARNILEDLLHSALDDERITFITGLRRVGKTSLLKLVIKHLLENSVTSPRNIFYVSLDDYLLLDNHIIDIVENVRKINGLSFSEKLYLFLDEVTYKEDYQLQLKNLHDNHNTKIFASSSSASLLKENLSFLTGRHITFELLPLDFREYLVFKNLSPAKKDAQLLDKHFHEYLTTGGIPGYVLNERADYLQTLVDDIISKDIAAGKRIGNLRILKDYFLLLMERSGKQTSVNKIAKILNISPDTSSRYLELFKNVFLIHELPRHGKTTERLLAPKKIFAADLGIRSFFTGKRDFGSLFENYTYLKLKRFNPEYIYQEGIEIDFKIGHDIIECKYHDEKLHDKQQKLMDSFTGFNKRIFRNQKDIEDFLKVR